MALASLLVSIGIVQNLLLLRHGIVDDSQFGVAGREVNFGVGDDARLSALDGGVYAGDVHYAVLGALVGDGHGLDGLLLNHLDRAVVVEGGGVDVVAVVAPLVGRNVVVQMLVLQPRPRQRPVLDRGNPKSG